MIPETIVNDPQFIEAVAHELRGEKEKSSSGDDEDGGDDDEDDLCRRVRHMIALRVQKRNAKRQGF